MALVERVFFRLPVLLAVTVFAQLFLVFSASAFGVGTPMGDLIFAYQPWSQDVLVHGQLLGITNPWVYPFPALVPIVLAALVSPSDYEFGWLVLRLILALIVTAFLVLFRRDAQAPSKRSRYLAGYLWVVFTVAIGPVSISRIDSWSVALAIVGCLLLVLASTRSAAALFTIAAWVKIWPVALFAPMLFNAKTRLRALATGAAISGGLIACGWLFGANASIFSFVFGQTERGIQIESPAAMPWLWNAAFGGQDSGIGYNRHIQTFEVFGANTGWVSFWLGPVQLGAILITFALGLIATRRGVAEPADVIAWTAMTGVCDLIFFNKVGSPQFYSWLAVPIILGVLLGAERWRLATGWVAVLSLATWAVYPLVYDDILAAGWLGTAVLTLRNLLMLGLLVYANVRLTALANSAQPADSVKVSS
jgi:hypothetical protein